MISGITRIVNTNLSDAQWLQACLPVRDGGLGVRRAVSLAIPAYVVSAASTRRLQDLILTDSYANDESYLLNVETKWTPVTWLPSPQPASSTKQRTWDEPGIQADKAAIWSCATIPVWNQSHENTRTSPKTICLFRRVAYVNTCVHKLLSYFKFVQSMVAVKKR